MDRYSDYIHTNLMEEVRVTLERIKAEITENIYTHGLHASGKTASSMSIEMYENGGKLTGRFAFGTLETGRKPGRIPGNMTEIIKEWAIAKGINITQIPYKRMPSDKWQPKYSVPERSLNAFAGAVAYNIRNKGTKLYQEGGNPVIYTPVIDDIINEFADSALLIIRNSINK